MSGRGGLFASGRWHSRGRRVVYTSATLSLAALEILVHTEKDLLPDDLVSVEIDVPESVSVRVVPAHSLPKDWQAYPGPSSLRALGDDWLDSGETSVLCVPSAVIPQEHNFLLNPEHPQAARLRVHAKTRFVLDPRLRS